MDKKVEIIPAVKKIHTYNVGVYCRVSSASGAQLHSLAAQASSLTRMVAAHKDWILADIYIDVKSGASTTGRDEFNRMLEDAKRGAINLILVKSISRFGRDAESIISSTRQLTEIGVPIIFDKQGIDTRSKEAEFYISNYAAIAQAENQNHSENVKWGINKKVKDGTSSLYDRPCYGYRSNEDGSFTINEEEAAVVRKIYNDYIDGMSIIKIKAALEKAAVPSPSGKSVWSKRTIDLILSNKKYCGYSTVYASYFEGEPKPKRKINKGQHEKFEMEDHHEPIIPLELFERAQQCRMERSNIELCDDGTWQRKPKISR